MYQTARERFKLRFEDDWLKLLSRSVNEPVVDAFEMPRFPHGRIQRQFIGSADAPALMEGFKLYKKCKSYFGRQELNLAADARYLDFGCGRGRFPRIFWYDFCHENIHGVDIDPDILTVCRALGCPGTYSRIEPVGRLPFEDRHFDFISAYSVFSHLPEEIANHWMKELSRVMSLVVYSPSQPSRDASWTSSRNWRTHPSLAGTISFPSIRRDCQSTARFLTTETLFTYQPAGALIEARMSMARLVFQKPISGLLGASTLHSSIIWMIRHSSGRPSLSFRSRVCRHRPDGS